MPPPVRTQGRPPHARSGDPPAGSARRVSVADDRRCSQAAHQVAGGRRRRHGPAMASRVTEAARHATVSRRRRPRRPGARTSQALRAPGRPRGARAGRPARRRCSGRRQSERAPRRPPTGRSPRLAAATSGASADPLLDRASRRADRSGSTAIGGQRPVGRPKPVGVDRRRCCPSRTRPGRPAPGPAADRPDGRCRAAALREPAAVVQAQRRDAHRHPAARSTASSARRRARFGHGGRPPRLGGRVPGTDDRAEPAVGGLRPARPTRPSGSPTPTGCTSTSWTPTSCPT